MKLRRIVLVAAALGGGPVACAFGLDGYTGGSGTTANDAGAGEDAVPLADGNTTNPPPDATTDSSFARCPSARGPDMVLIDDAKGTRFCIDSTEVTNAHYAAFLRTSPRTKGQPDVCGGNATYVPTDTRSFDDIAQQQYPVAFVDWCDARAFCAWAGKRLCGHIGGGPLQSDADRVDPAASQFMYVCTKGGTQLYSYGTTYRPGVCNTGVGGAQPMVVGARGDCQGGFPGVFDLVGNVGEWTDDCANGDFCPVNSSSFTYVDGDPRSTQRCDHFDPQTRGDTFVDLGFRCCFD